MTPSSILVTDGTQRSALAVVRSLGSAGYTITVIADRLPCLAASSRYATEAFLAPDPVQDPGGFADAVVGTAAQIGARVVLPVTDASLLALLPARERLGSAVLPFPDLATVAGVADKRAVLEAARSMGIAVPPQLVLPTRDPATAGLSEMDFPLVLKPYRSVGEANGRRVKMGVRHALDRPTLLRLINELPDAAFPLLVQRRVTGPGIGVFLLLWEGQRLAAFAHRRLLEKPPSGGVSVRAESTVLDPSLVDQAEGLLRSFGWQGVAMVEFKRGDGGTPYLMEINGRFWGSLQLAIDAGVDFPKLLVEAALGGQPTPVTSYRTGVRTHWWWGEVDHMLARLRRSARDLALPSDAPSLVSVGLGLLTAPFRGVRGEVLRVSDPAPALRETIDWLRGR